MSEFRLHRAYICLSNGGKSRDDVRFGDASLSVRPCTLTWVYERMNRSGESSQAFRVTFSFRKTSLKAEESSVKDSFKPAKQSGNETQ